MRSSVHDILPPNVRRSLKKFGADFKIPRTRAKEVVRQVERAVSRWRKEGRSIGMTDAELEPFAPAFEHAERNAARRA